MSVMTALAVGTAVVGAGMSFQQAAQARRNQRKADADAAKYLADARTKAQKDEFAALNIPLDAFEAQLENNLQNTTTAIQALQEGDARALASGVAQVGRQSADVAEGVRIAQGEQMFGLDKMKAENRDAINQQLIELDAAMAQDAAKRAAAADAQVAAATTSGIGSLSSALSTALTAQKLNPVSKADKELMKALDKAGVTIQEYTANPDKFPNILGRQQLPPVTETAVSVEPDGSIMESFGVRSPLSIRGGEGPFNSIFNMQNFGLTMPDRSRLVPNTQNPMFTGYMGADLNRLNYSDGILGKPLTFDEILKQYQTK